MVVVVVVTVSTQQAAHIGLRPPPPQPPARDPNPRPPHPFPGCARAPTPCTESITMSSPGFRPMAVIMCALSPESMGPWARTQTVSVSGDTTTQHKGNGVRFWRRTSILQQLLPNSHTPDLNTAP